MKKKFMSIPTEYNKSSIFEADDIKIPVEILVMHDKKNLNKSNFEMEAIEFAKESIKNIPILGYIKRIDGTDSKDFAGHEIELSIKNGELKLVYLERPIGVIPETNNYEYIEVNGKNYVKVLGYIWREYLNDGYEILQENPNKSVSMEITVDDYSISKDGIVDIKAYRYLGVTILGDSVSPGMEGANLQVLGQFTDKFSNDYYEKVQSLNNELKEKFSKPQFKIDSYFISKEEAFKLVDKANSIFVKLGFQCLEYIVDGKEYQITGIINKKINIEATKDWGFDIYDKDTITIYSLDFETIDIASISVSSVKLLLKNNNDKFSKQQHFELKFNDVSPKGGETQKMTKEKEGENMDEKLELIAQYNFTLDQLDFNIEEISIEELELKLKEFSKESSEPEVTNISFSATYNQKREALRNALDPIIVKNAEDKIIEETYFYVSDFDDEFVFVEKDHWTSDGYEFTYGRVKYAFDETTITATVDMASWEKMVRVWLTEEENQKLQDDRNAFATMSTEFETLKTKVSEHESTITEFEATIGNLTSENSKLQEFKSTVEFENKRIEIEGLIEDFESVLKDNEDFEQIKKDVAIDEKLVAIEYQVLEKELYALVGKVKYTKNNKPTKKPQVFSSKVSVIEESDINDSYYGDAIKYLKK